MSRPITIERYRPRDLTWLFPREIIARLEMIATDCGISPEVALGEAMPKNVEIDALDMLVNGLILPAVAERKSPAPGYGRLPKNLQQHLVHLIHTALAAARTLQAAQPDTPLGFPKGPQGVLSNLLSASWIDLTQGGKVQVKFEEVDPP